MQSYPNAPYPNGAAMPVRYMVPPGYRQPYPPFVNQSFDRFAVMPTTYRAPPMARPVHYPPAYGPGYGQGGAPTQPGPGQPAPRQPAPTQHAPTVQAPKSSNQSAKQPFFNPNGTNKKNSVASIPESKTPAAKKGAKEFKDTAFTIEPDGSKNEAIRGLVSNDDINNLLKHKGTKVKVSKIYRITKTKPEVLSDSSDEELPPQPPPPPAQRPRSASADSYCSACDDRPCSQCLDQRPPHAYDDCPLCRAQLQQQQPVHVYDDCPECRAQRQPHVYDDCAECRAERNRQLSRR